MNKKSIHFWSPEEKQYLVDCYQEGNITQKDAAIVFVKKYKNRSIMASQFKLNTLINGRVRSLKTEERPIRKSVQFPQNQKIELTNIKKVLINADGTITIHL
jgi:hypothetical protein